MRSKQKREQQEEEEAKTEEKRGTIQLVMFSCYVESRLSYYDRSCGVMQCHIGLFEVIILCHVI